MKKWPLTVGFNVWEPPPPHKNDWLNSIVIAISQLPLDLGEVGLGSKGFVPCCVHGWMLWAASSSVQVQHEAWTKQCQAQSLSLLRISLHCWGVSLARLVSVFQDWWDWALQYSWIFSVKCSLRRSLVHKENCVPPEEDSSCTGLDMPAVVDKKPLQVEHVKTGAYS